MLPAEKLLSLINALGGIVWEAEPETFQFLFVSDEAERILGYSTQKWLEPGFWRRHTHPEDVERCASFCLAASRRGEDHEFEYRMIAADGRIVWLRDIVSVRKSPDGSTRLVGIALDVTKRKEDEADKLRMTELYTALVANSSDNISLLRADGVSVYQSEAVSRQLGYEPAELVGRSSFDLIHPEDAPAIIEQFQQIFTSPDSIAPVRYRFRHRDGSWRYLETVARPFAGVDGTVLAVCNTRDVTEMVAAQRDLEAAQQELAEAMKMEAIGRLAGGVAHDFNNLLTVIAGYAELVSATLDTTDLRSEDLGEIKRAAHRASLLTRQLLAFSRKQVLRPEILDINTIVREVSLLVRRLIGDDVELVTELASTPLPVYGDRSQLEQVLLNLSVNARDAMPVGGRLIIRTVGNDSTVFVIVTDNGSGIPSDVLDLVFEPFFTTKDVGKGAGLGLSTAYGIVKQSQGDIQVQSEVNKGTVFTITLPRAREAEAVRVNPGDEPRGGSETILVVEDSDEERELIEHVLLRLGYDVLAASDGRIAADICRRHQQKISLLITDVVQEPESGPQLYARISAIVPDIDVLYISGYTGETVLARGVREEGVAYLQKPFTPNALAMRVREVLDDATRGANAG